MREGRLLVAAAAGISALLSSIFIARASFVIDGQRYFSLFDDAMVSMRYARNLAEGYGLRWNAGEPPVEGYTNFLWTLWMALVHRTGLPDRLTSLVVSMSGAALIVAAVFLAARIARRLAPEDADRVASVAAFSVALCYPLIFWTLRGMEVGLIAVLILEGVDMAVALADRRAARSEDPRLGSEEPGMGSGTPGTAAPDAASVSPSAVARLAIVLALLTLVRPDGIVPALVIGALAAAGIAASAGDCPSAGACSGATRGQEVLPRLLLILCGIPLTVLAAHTCFRWWYYGDALPNTYYLKMTGVPLFVRISRGAAAVGSAALRMMLVPFALAALSSRLRRTYAGSLVLLVPISLAAYAVYVGGDAWEWMPITNRYLTPALPLLMVGAAVALAGRKTRLLVLDCLILVVIVSGPGASDWVKRGGSHVNDDAITTWLGVRVRQTTSETTRIGVVWAGAVPYFSRRPAIDFLGKSDPVIARRQPVLPFYPGHDRFDYGYSIGKLRPDVILQLWFPTQELITQIVKLGYEPVFAGIFVRHGASVDVARLRAAFNEPLPKPLGENEPIRNSQ